MENKVFGQHLKEVGYSFLLADKISSKEAKTFVLKLINDIGMTFVRCSVNKFENGGFDIACTIKESIIYFGFWEGSNYVRMFCSSCKRFDGYIIVDKIKEYFKLKSKVKMEIIKDISIKGEINSLCLTPYTI